MSPPRQLHLWAFLQGVGHYPAGWRHPDAQPRAVYEADYYVKVGQLCERGRFDAIVFGDQLNGRNAAGRASSRLPMATLDPFTLLALMAAATERVGLVATVSSTYNDVLSLAEKFATLDVLSSGRAGWNIVTSAHPATPWNFGERELQPKAERYARAESVVGACCALWDSAAPHGEGAAEVVFKDQWIDLTARMPAPRSPQVRPALVQAGQSQDGRDFAAKTAEAIFCPAPTFDAGKAYRDDIRARLPRFGRHPEGVRIMPGLSFVLGSTEAEARAKDDLLMELASPELCIEYLSEPLGYDLTVFDPDAPIPTAKILETCEFPKDHVQMMLSRGEGLTLSEFARRTTRTPQGHHVYIGPPERMADMMIDWVNGGACDGFTLQPGFMPQELALFVEHVVPILQRRGALRLDYAAPTLREHLGLAPLR